MATRSDFHSMVEVLLNAATQDELWEAYSEAMQAYGFAHLFYNVRPMVGLPSSIDWPGYDVRSTISRDKLSKIVTRETILTMEDVIFETAPENKTTALKLSELLQHPNADASARDLCSKLSEHGFAAASLIPMARTTPRAIGAVVLCGPNGTSDAEMLTLWNKAGEEPTLLSRIMHLRYCTLPLPTRNEQLTARQRQVLEWSSTGRTVNEIADKICLSSATVEKHLRLARDTLGVQSTAQAILKAHLTGQIFPENLVKKLKK